MHFLTSLNLQPSGGMLYLQCCSLNPTSLLCVLMPWTGLKNAKGQLDVHLWAQLCSTRSDSCWEFPPCVNSVLHFPLLSLLWVNPYSPGLWHKTLCSAIFELFDSVQQSVDVLISGSNHPIAVVLSACLHRGCISTLSLRRSRLHSNSIEFYGHRLQDTIFSYQITAVHHRVCLYKLIWLQCH